jgi:hypothetical protein
VILFSSRIGPIYRVPDTGGAPTAATRLDEASQESAHLYPWFLPDGHHFLYEAAAPAELFGNVTIRAGSLDSRESKVLLTANSNAFKAGAGLPSGKPQKYPIVMIRQTNISPIIPD